MSREPLSSSGQANNKVNVSHQFIIEHHSISVEKIEENYSRQKTENIST